MSRKGSYSSPSPLWVFLYPKFAKKGYGFLMTKDGSPEQGTPSFFTDTDALPVVGLAKNEGKTIPRKRVWSWAFWDWGYTAFQYCAHHLRLGSELLDKCVLC